MATTKRKSDREIQQDVLRELAWDPRVDAADVGVSVDQGTVTLTGSVPTYAERIAAVEAAHRVAGVLDVADDLRVKVPGHHQRDDADLARAVRHALEWDVVVPHERIHTTVADGRVTLSGQVDSPHQRDAAIRVVRALVGVRDVTDEIEIAPGTVSSAAVRNAIEQALERRATRAAEHLEVEVVDGRVILRGVVHSWPEREAVVGAARYTKGVRAVDDQLVVAAS
ncbi:MAG TPA: BON domain-containing protein [Chloroflexota bacterium]|nr:BON domain-containing protein [Chloroflexota bacterium]